MVSSIIGVGKANSTHTIVSLKSSQPTTVIVADESGASMVPSTLTVNLMTGYEYLQKAGMWIAMFSAMALPSLNKSARASIRIPVNIFYRAFSGLAIAEVFNWVTNALANKLFRN